MYIQWEGWTLNLMVLVDLVSSRFGVRVFLWFCVWMCVFLWACVCVWHDAMLYSAWWCVCSWNDQEVPWIELYHEYYLCLVVLDERLDLLRVCLHGGRTLDVTDEQTGTVKHKPHLQVSPCQIGSHFPSRWFFWAEQVLDTGVTYCVSARNMYR